MIFNVIICALLITVISLFIGQIKPEYSFFIKLSGVLIILIWTVSYAGNRIEEFYSYFARVSDITDILKILIKAAAVCIATSITSSLCKENGNTAIAGCVELFGRFAMFALCLPLIESVIKTALTLIG